MKGNAQAQSLADYFRKELAKQDGRGRSTSRDVDYTVPLPAVRSGRPAAAGRVAGLVAGLAELRSLANKAAADNPKLAELVNATIARREGKAIAPDVEFSIGGPVRVVHDGAARRQPKRN